MKEVIGAGRGDMKEGKQVWEQHGVREGVSEGGREGREWINEGGRLVGESMHGVIEGGSE